MPSPDIPEEQKKATDRQRVWQQTIKDQYAVLLEKRFNDSSLTFEWVNDSLAVIGTFPTEEDAERGHRPQLHTIEPEKSRSALRIYDLDSEVNKARSFKLERETYVAAICGDGRVYVYTLNEAHAPPLLIEKHTENGFGLAWSKSGLLATGSSDGDSGSAHVWKIDFKNWSVEHLYTVEYSEQRGVNDLCWCGDNLVTADEAGILRLYNTKGGLLCSHKAHENQSIDCVASSPIAPNLFITAGGDSSIKVWNFRLLARNNNEPKKCLATLTGHNSRITCLRFSPFLDGVFASGAENGQVILWNLKNLGKPQRINKSVLAKPEIIFSHGGHILSISDICWSTKRPRLIGTMSEDCRLQMWSPYVLDDIECTVVDGKPSAAAASVHVPSIPELPGYLLDRNR